MILLGMGMGLSTTPANEAILGVVRPEQAGVGSAVNDATRLIGGTLGVAVLGSICASLYRTKIDDSTAPAMTAGQTRQIKVDKPRQAVWRQICAFADVPTWYDEMGSLRA